MGGWGMGEPAPNAGYREAIEGLLWGYNGAKLGYCGGTRPQRGLSRGYCQGYKNT